ncbi:MAG: hypothetical protein AAFN10_24320, partial [Bacteroidota bacterium]
ISLQQPDTIKPGQKVAAMIRLTDHLGQPVPNTDLTVWGINAQFPRENVPELAYLGPKILSEATRSSLSTSGIDRYLLNQRKTIDKGRAEDLGLMNRDYYQLYFPDSLVLKYYPIADTNVAMYAPFVFDSLGQQQQVNFIWQDSVIKYYVGANPNQAYCILSKEGGEVDLDLRLDGELLHLPDVLLKKGYKLELSINRDQLPRRASMELRPYLMTYQEADIINQYFIEIEPSGGDVCYLWQKAWDYPIRVSAYTPFQAGPFSSDSIYLLYPGQFGRKFAWTSRDRYQIEKLKTYVRQADAAQVGYPFPMIYQGQKPGEYISPLDSLNLSIAQGSDQSYIPESFDGIPDLDYPYFSSPQAGLKIFIAKQQDAKALHFILRTKADSQNAFVKSASKASSTWALPPGTYGLEAHFADSLCIQYPDVVIKADSIWVLNLAHLKGDTLAKSQWLSSTAVQANHTYHQSWQVPQPLNYSSDDIGDYTLKLRLVDAFGEAVTQAKVWANGNRQTKRLQISDEEGWVYFPAMKDSTPELSIFHPDYRYTTFQYGGEDKVLLNAMPSEHLALWQAALNATHKIERTYYQSRRYYLTYFASPPPFIPDPSLFYQDTLTPIRKQITLDSSMLPIIRKSPPAREVDNGFPEFFLPLTGVQWGINSTLGLAKMQGVLTYEGGGFARLGFWYQLSRRLQLNLSGSLESQYASAQRGPAIIQANSLWENWYEAGAAVYPAIRRDRWTSELQLQYAPIKTNFWELSLGLGAGIMGGRVALDARRDGQLYDYQAIFEQDRVGTPLSNPDRTDILRGIRDESYETTYALRNSIAPYALTSAQISYRLAPRLHLYLNYQFQLSGLNTWDTEIGSYDPLTQGPSGIINRRRHQQIGIGVSVKLSKATTSFWWQSPTTAHYGELTETRKLVESLTEDSDSDGVPDLYDKEPFSSHRY